MPSLCSAVLSRSLAAAGASTQWLALARQSLFCVRQPRKIDPAAFLLGVCLWAAQPLPSLRRAATFIGLSIGDTVSKQNIAKRFGRPAICFVRAALGRVLRRLAERAHRVAPGALVRFKRVLVQDSTTVGLPPNLAAQFPGNANQQARCVALMKIQCLYDLLAAQFVAWDLTSFRVNDQKAAAGILAVAQPDDLVIRDLGYFSLAALQQMIERGIFFLSRLWQGVCLRTASGQPLDLLGALQRDGWLDLPVRLTDRYELPVRLVALPVSDAVANRRRRLARQNRDRRSPASAKRLALMGWDIFITNVPDTVWSTAMVCQVYGLRWRIEIVFKAAKSYFRLETVPPRVSAIEVEMLIWARLLLISLWQSWLPASQPEKQYPALSLLKTAEFFNLFWPLLLLKGLGSDLPQLWYDQVNYHGRYEKRRRLNFVQKMQILG